MKKIELLTVLNVEKFDSEVIFLSALFILIFIVLIILDRRESEKTRVEIETRRSHRVRFKDNLTIDDFYEIVESRCKLVKRIDKVDINNGLISVDVLSQSGISRWSFEIDFNDYGSITGRYWLESENKDSNIPKNIAKSIANSIKNKLGDN